MNYLSEPVLRASGAAFQRQMNGLLKTRFELNSAGPHAYDGEIHRSYVSPKLRLADISFSPHTTRLKAGRPQHSGRSFLVSHQKEGTSFVSQAGRQTPIGPNEIFFIDTSQPFEIQTDEIRTRSIYLDSYFWQEIFPEREMYTATALRCDEGLGFTCRTMIDEVFSMDWNQGDRAMQRIAGCLANLLSVSMVTNRPLDPNDMEPNKRTLDRIRDVIRSLLGDPDLDCARIADEVGLSVRQVHAVFSRTGDTLMRYIWKQRLLRIAAELENDTMSRKPVSAIAFEWGFNEAAHFSRLFKAQFGMPPAQYRALLLARQGAGEGDIVAH